MMMASCDLEAMTWRRYRGRRARSASWALGAWLLAIPAHALPLEEILHRAKPAVVLLSVPRAYGDSSFVGSGFLISKDGRVATNFHVVDSALRLEATLSDGKERDVVGAWVLDEESDLAILQLETGTYAS